jgi:hypothetical protein
MWQDMCACRGDMSTLHKECLERFIFKAM